MFVLILLTQDALIATTTPDAADTAMTSQHPMTSCDITCCHDNTPSPQLSLADDSVYYYASCNMPIKCPVITISTDSELADVGESIFAAELPLQSDWLPMTESSSSLANHSSDLLTLQSLDMNDNCMKLDASDERQVLVDKQVLAESDVTDGRLTSDDSLTGDLVTRGTTHVSLHLSLSIYADIVTYCVR